MSFGLSSCLTPFRVLPVVHVNLRPLSRQSWNQRGFLEFRSGPLGVFNRGQFQLFSSLLPAGTAPVTPPPITDMTKTMGKSMHKSMHKPIRQDQIRQENELVKIENDQLKKQIEQLKRSKKPNEVIDKLEEIITERDDDIDTLKKELGEQI